MTEQPRHTPGPAWTEHSHTDANGNGYYSVLCGDKSEYAEAGDVVILADKIPKENARLLTAAYTSYDKHCGPRAVECAEGDLLGEALELLRDINLATPVYPEHTNIIHVTSSGIKRIRAVLAKASGEAVGG